MSPPPLIASRLLPGGLVCAAHIAVLVCMGAAFTAEKAVHGGAPVIHVTLEGQGFAGLASPHQDARPKSAEVSPAKPLAAPPKDATSPHSPTQAPSRPASNPNLSVSRPATSMMGAASTSSTTSAEAASATAPAVKASMASPSPGAGAPLKGASGDQATDPYEAQVIAWLEQHKRHPGGIAGRIIVRFTLDRRGRLLASSIVSGDSERRLERVALLQLQEAAPFPRSPSDASWRTRSFVVRLDYRSSQT